MRRFRFKLEPVRALREHEETAAKEALARELALGFACEDELRAASERLAAARGRTALPEGAPLDGARLQAQQAFLERRERERAVAEHRATTQADRIEAGRGTLADAARDREAIERLKERRRRLHEAEAARAEEGSLSEIALATHRRRGNAA